VGGLSHIFWVVALVWAALLIYNLICLKATPKLSAKSILGPVQRAKVSILVPARNEASRLLEQAIRSMLAQDWPDLEVIAVDDCSTDNTLNILEAISGRDDRLIVVRGRVLPPGWVGKPWALNQASKQARGEWLLATDADVVFHPSALRLAMALAQNRNCAAVTLVPGFCSNSFWAKLIMPVLGWAITLLYPFWLVNNPRSRVALGVGGFFLMRRDALDKVGGYEAIRSEVIDDLKMAQLLKRAGFRLYLAAAYDLLRTPMYSSLAEIFEGMGKNSFSGIGSSLPLALLSSMANLATTTLPLIFAITSLLFADYRLAGSALAAYASMVIAFVPVYIQARISPLYAPLSFLANVILVLILMVSAWRVVTGRGVIWKSRRLYVSLGASRE
jgi:chlorobactene glucosyltransferase